MAKRTKKQADKAPMFMFPAGTGTIRSKMAQEADILFGRGGLPGVGQVLFDAVREIDHIDPDTRRRVYKSDELNFTVTKITGQGPEATRRVVAKLTLPAGPMEQREGVLTMNDVMDKDTGELKTWKVVAHLRRGPEGAITHMAIRLPEVKFTSQSTGNF